MESNVQSWYTALNNGYEPRLYPHTDEDVPLGEYEAVLDFKIWAKKAVAINCYFTQKDTARKFQLTVYGRKDCLYRLDKGIIDFKVCAVNTLYLITVVLKDNSKIAFKDAALCAH